MFDFYEGRIVPSGSSGFASEVHLTRSVGGHAVRFVGRWTRDGQPPEFVEGLVAWDAVLDQLRIVGVFYHGAVFQGRVVVLDRERRILQRQWTGHYPNGQTVDYRETWTPVDDERFEWRIEKREDGGWTQDLPPGMDRSPIHRVIRSSL